MTVKSRFTSARAGSATASLLAALALLVTACGGNSGSGSASGSGSGSGASAKPATIRMGVLPIAGLAGWELAKDNGYFKAAQLTPQFTTLKTPADMVPSLIGGKLEVGALNPGNLAQAAQQKLPLKIIGATYYANGEQGLYVKPSSPIKSIADLKGKTIGLGALKNNSHAALLEQLAQAGIGPNDVKFTLVPIADAPAQLRAGRVDAAQISEPLVSVEGDKIRAVVPNLYAPYGPQSVNGYTIVAAKFAQEHPDEVKRIKQALEKGNDAAAQGGQPLRNAIASLTGLKPEILSKMVMPAFGNDLKMDSTAKQLELMKKYGFISKTVDLSSLELK